MVSLTKGQKVSLTKEDSGLKDVLVGLGWDAKAKKGLFGGGGLDFDLDAFAVGCRDGRYEKRDDLVYFGNLTGCDGAVKHLGDNLTGAGDGDDEQIVIKLNKVPDKMNRIIVCVNIYKAKSRKQDFGQVKNAFIRIANKESGVELFRFNLSDDYDGAIGMIFGELYRHGDEWKFNPVGEGVKETSIEAIAQRFA